MIEVSVIIPVFNRKELLRDLLGSLKDQTYKDWEAIVVDDGSTDGCEEMMKQICEEDSRIQYKKRDESPAGACKCRNLGLSLARGEFILFFDSDDLLMPHCLEKRRAVLKEFPELDFAVFQGEVFENQPGDKKCFFNIDSQENDLDRYLSLDIPWVTDSAFWRKDALRKNGLWDESLLSGQDWDFFVRAIVKKICYKKFFHLKPDFYYRDSDPNKKYYKKFRAWGLKKLDAISNTEKEISNNGLLTAQRKRLLAGMKFRILAGIASGGNLGHVLKQWYQCCVRAKIPLRYLIEGWIYFLIRFWPKRDYKFRQYLEGHWPSELMGPSNRRPRTLKKVKMDPSEADQ